MQDKKTSYYYVSHARERSSRKFIINANNGCLGDFDRGRTQTAAILVGEVPSTFDPAVSEWSNPSHFARAMREVNPVRGYISV